MCVLSTSESRGDLHPSRPNIFLSRWLGSQPMAISGGAAFGQGVKGGQRVAFNCLHSVNPKNLKNWNLIRARPVLRESTSTAVKLTPGKQV